MIKLYTFGKAFGLPDGSPFVVKAMMLLKLAGLQYQEIPNKLGKAPKGKLPFIEDEGQIIADTYFIRKHIEKKHGFDFDKYLTPAQKGQAWAIEKLCEDHLYWVNVRERWLEGDNFAKGPAIFFKAVPALIRPLVTTLIKAKVKRNLQGQGLGRHSREELMQLAFADMEALSRILGDNHYILGDKTCGADATAFAFMNSVLSPHFDTDILKTTEHYPNIKNYCERMYKEFFG